MIKLVEGPGAGYTISGEIKNIKINSFEYQIINETEIDVDCDIDAELFDCEFYSYYYGGDIDSVPIKITRLHLETFVDEISTRDIDEYDIRDTLIGVKIKALLGGGWSHSTFDGEVTTDDIKDNSYGDFYIVEMDFYIPNKTIVNYIDRVVTGDTYANIYTVYDYNDNIIYDEAETEYEAIKYAEAHDDASYIVRIEFLESPDGEWDFTGDDEVVWER